MSNKYFVLLCLFALACNSHIKKAITPSPIDKKEWTIETTPNNLDVVGVIFGIDANGRLLRIPGGKLTVDTIKSPIVLTETKNSKHISYGALVNFLNLSKYIDSSTNVGFKDTSKVDIAFSVKDGIITNINDDIASAFQKQKKVIESNMSTLDLDSTKLFLVLETIQSSNVNISFNKSKNLDAQIYAKIQKLFGLNANIKVNTNDNTQLIYNLQEPLVVFYKLRSINTSISKIKGSPLQKVELSLGEEVTSDEVLYK